MEFREWFEDQEKLKEGLGNAAVSAFIQTLIRQIVPDAMMSLEDQIIQIANQLAMHFHMNVGMAIRFVQQYLKSNPNLNLPSMPA
jgi:hypothetical protein